MSKVITFTYTNWKGETTQRTVVPIRLWFGSTEWHKEDQWLLNAYDLDKKVERDFAMKDISKWKPVIASTKEQE